MARTGKAKTTKSAPFTASTGSENPSCIKPSDFASSKVFCERVDATIVVANFSATITRAKLDPMSPKPINATFLNRGCDITSTLLLLKVI